jgi:hypothetical protein
MIMFIKQFQSIQYNIYNISTASFNQSNKIFTRMLMSQFQPIQYNIYNIVPFWNPYIRWPRPLLRERVEGSVLSLGGRLGGSRWRRWSRAGRQPNHQMRVDPLRMAPRRAASASHGGGGGNRQRRWSTAGWQWCSRVGRRPNHWMREDPLGMVPRRVTAAEGTGGGRGAPRGGGC